MLDICVEAGLKPASTALLTVLLKSVSIPLSI